MKQGEIKKEIQSIVDQLIRKYDPLKIILFGSAGRGEYDKVNDLDFLIVKVDVPRQGLARMRELDLFADVEESLTTKEKFTGHFETSL